MADLEQIIADNTKWYGGHTLIPDDWYQIYQPLNLRNSDGYGISIGGHSSSGAIIEQMTPGTPMLVYDSPTDTRAGLDIHDLTLCSQAGGTIEAIRNINGGRSKYRDLVFRGVTHTIHAQNGIMHSIRNILVEPFGPADANGGAIYKCGQLFLHADPGVASGYCQYISVDDYQTVGAAYGPLVVLARATNVVLSHMLTHEPGDAIDAIQIYDDSQGIQISDCSIVKGRDGVVVMAANGNRPLVIEIDNFNTDQMTGVGIRNLSGRDVTIIGGSQSTVFQGVTIGTYPDVERSIILGMRDLSPAANGIVTDPGARYFDISHTMSTGAVNGAAIVLSGNQDHYELTNNSGEVVQGNAYGIVVVPTGDGPHKVVSGNLT